MISRRSLLHFRNVPSSRFLYCSIRNRTFHMLNPRDAILPTQKNREMCAGISIGNKYSECLERLQVENLFYAFELKQTWPKPLLWKGKLLADLQKGSRSHAECSWCDTWLRIICSSFPIVFVAFHPGRFRFSRNALVNPRDKTPPYKCLQWNIGKEYDFCIVYFITKSGRELIELQ